MKGKIYDLKVEDGIAWIGWTGKEGSSQMTFGRHNVRELIQVIKEYEAKPDIQALVFYSTMDSGFAAGADIEEFVELAPSPENAQEAVKTFQEFIETIHKCPKPTVACIHKNCLGGGCEVALACRFRISAHDSTLGLPEVQLGLLPAGGGTQRLPRLIGLRNSLIYLLTGKRLNAKEAYKKGLVDALVPMHEWEKFVKNWLPKAKPRRLSWLQKIEFSTPLSGLIIQAAQKDVLKKTKDFYPAPLKILECVKHGLHHGVEEGLKKELSEFLSLLQGSVSKSLIHVFFATNQSKKYDIQESLKQEALERFINPLLNHQKSIGVLGAGLMGRGIAQVFAEAGCRVILIDQKKEALQNACNEIHRNWQRKITRGTMKRSQYISASEKIYYTTFLEALKNVSIIIEAVFENLELKQEILKKCEQIIPKPFLFASNTSGIPIEQIGQKARSPELVIGMHFFSPVPQMPLIEIIKNRQTSPIAIESVFQLTKILKKQPTLVSDGPGFFTTRILVMSLLEALLILEEGGAIEEIDRFVESFGMPMGPLKLMDSIGWDTGVKICQHLKERAPLSSYMPGIPQFMLKAMEQNPKRVGLKGGLGFYIYESGNPKPIKPDPEIYRLIGETANVRLEKELVIDRIMGVFMNEAVRCLEEGIVDERDIGDIAAIYGLGFPPFRGGPLWEVTHDPRWSEKLPNLAKYYGARFTPAGFLAQRPQKKAS